MNTAIETQIQDALNRRIFLRNSTSFLGLSALSGMLQGKQDTPLGLTGFPNFPAKAKRIIYLFQSGAPSQMDLFDPKPAIKDRRGEDLPDSIRKGQRLTTMTSGQKTFPVAPSIFKFAQYGQSGMWFSELMPHMSKLADKFAMVRSVHTPRPSITTLQLPSVRPVTNLLVALALVLGSVTVLGVKTETCLLTLCLLLSEPVVLMTNLFTIASGVLASYPQSIRE